MNRPGTFKKGYTPWNKGLKGAKSHRTGKKWSAEVKKKIQVGNNKRFVGKVLKTREITLLRKRKEFKYWREAVYKRDHWTCQDCGARSKKGVRVILHPHHIKLLSTHPEKAYDVKNGVTLCSKCHQKRHKGIKLTLV